VMDAPYAVMQTSPDARAVMFGLMREVVTLAERAGVNLHEADIAAWDGFLQTLSPRGKTSMLQDIDAGRKTEVEIFAGKAVELGRAYGIPTPMNEMVLHIIRVLESRATQSL
jgi:2-dehydropantoate 2-reductase